MEKISKKLDGLIDILDQSLDYLIEKNDVSGLMMDEVPIYGNYEAILKFTFMHEAPILALAFTLNSEYLIIKS